MFLFPSLVIDLRRFLTEIVCSLSRGIWAPQCQTKALEADAIVRAMYADDLLARRDLEVLPVCL